MDTETENFLVKLKNKMQLKFSKIQEKKRGGEKYGFK